MDLFTQIKMAVSVKEAVSLVRQRSDRHAEAADDAASGGSVRYLRLELPCADAPRGRGRRSGGAETKGVSARQVKTGKKFARKRNHFTKTRCSEQRTGITKKCAYARFYEMPHGFVKSIPLTYEEGIDRRVSSGFEQNRFLHQTAKWMRWRAYPLRCFHHEKTGGFL